MTKLVKESIAFIEKRIEIAKAGRGIYTERHKTPEVFALMHMGSSSH